MCSPYFPSNCRAFLAFQICQMMFAVKVMWSSPLCLLLASNIPSHHLQKFDLHCNNLSHCIGASFHIGSALLQKKIICSTVSSPSPQHLHNGEPFPVLLCINSFTGMLLYRHLHMKCFIFGLSLIPTSSSTLFLYAVRSWFLPLHEFPCFFR